MNFLIGFNWWAFAAKGLAIVVVAGALFGGGYYEGTQQALVANANAPAIAANAQHTQDQKKHITAVTVSAAAAKQNTSTQSNGAAQVKIVHDKPTVIVQAAPNCPADPVMDPDVLNAYNQAGQK